MFLVLKHLEVSCAVAGRVMALQKISKSQIPRRPWNQINSTLVEKNMAQKQKLRTCRNRQCRRVGVNRYKVENVKILKILIDPIIQFLKSREERNY